MRVISEISIASIIVDRWPMNQRTLGLVRHLENKGSVPPVHIQKTTNGKWRILDGRHRILANKLLGNRMILARYGS